MFFPPADDDSADAPSSDEASAPAPPERPNRSRARRRRHLRVLIGALAMVVAVCVLGAVAVGGYVRSIDHSLDQNLKRADDLPADVPDDPTEAPRPAKNAGDAINYVIMGSDSRVPGNAELGRSDVLMVVHISGDRKTAAVISFPRDMYVPIPGHGKNKINAAFAFGGAKLTLRTLEGLLDARMDHVALIDFDGFVALTDLVGGVTVNNLYYSKSGGYEFPVGRITISGEKALAYVRERHQLPHGDLDRAERQRQVVAAIMAKGMSRQLITDPIRFNRFVSQAAGNVTVDQSLRADDLRKAVLSLRFDASQIRILQAPISGFGTSPDGQSIDIVNQSKLDELGQALRQDQLSSYLQHYPQG